MRTLETERLILRDWRETDIGDMFVCISCDCALDNIYGICYNCYIM